MDFSRRCVDEFDERDWRRGREYFRNGAVVINKDSEFDLDAEVQGSEIEPYEVKLDWSEASERTLMIGCSCPRYDDEGICKHIAATIFAAEARGIGSRVPGKGKLFIESLSIEDFDDDWELADGGDDEGSYDEPYDARRLYEQTFRTNVKSPKSSDKSARSNWKQLLAPLCESPQSYFDEQLAWRSGKKQSREIWYVLDLPATLQSGRVCISLRQRTVKKDGTLGKFQYANPTVEEIVRLISAEERVLIELLIGNDRNSGYGHMYGMYSRLSDFSLTPAMHEILLPQLCATNKFGWTSLEERALDEQFRPLAWDDGPPWTLKLSIAKTPDQRDWLLSGQLQREDVAEELARPQAILSSGLAIFDDRISRFDGGGDFRWTFMLRKSGPILIPVKEEKLLVERLAQSPVRPQIALPNELQWEEETPLPIRQLKIAKAEEAWRDDLACRVSFLYGENSATPGDARHSWFDRQTRRAIRRNVEVERAALNELVSAGAKYQSTYGYHSSGAQFFVKPKALSRLVGQLTQAGWLVEAEGSLVRRPGSFSISISSGVDWFDLEASCDFEGVTASLPSLLEALRQGRQYVKLDDGTQGILPDDWLARYAGLADLGKIDGDRIRFLPTQACLLDALLAAQDKQSMRIDKVFAALRDKLRSFDGIRECAEPKTFCGELRPYQRLGLGWLHFLDDFGFGGCLADDMGLGKTIQVLALLEERRRNKKRRRSPENGATEKVSGAPSLVVVPRSLVFNWIDEASRFTPKLRVINYTGLDRGSHVDQLDDHNLVVTTYGTLKRDIVKLREIPFDYVILDEAQAIKNATSQAAKACRLLNARRRLAMSGTPVENHLGELGSLFEFLNPGMLGQHRKFNDLFVSNRRTRQSNGETEGPHQSAKNLEVLAQALRPFILRRTKQQVLSELPPKTEQTLYCELSSAERKLYDELREHYRRSLLERVSTVGLKKSKIQVLEALLRLRQAACHPGLLDKKKADAGSAKLETLLEQLTEVIAEGHKALVFSQFTSLLAIVRTELDSRKVDYEYLDGRTVKRRAKVERFQTDRSCPLFLISLKAGGVGLNLTAADYVFILDPWWNPAVEAQAVDRAHRIGQDKHVFAYRLIARDTVEEKILQLQAHKRNLADAIISADNSVIRDLSAEDLQLLLS